MFMYGLTMLAVTIQFMALELFLALTKLTEMI